MANFPTTGNDVIYGSLNSETIDALAGNDRVFGRDGHDVLFGNDGNDTLDGGDGIDTIDGGAGDDILTIWEYGEVLGGADTVFGGVGDDRVNVWFYWYNAAGNQLHGDDGFDTLSIRYSHLPGQSITIDATTGIGTTSGASPASFNFDGFERYIIETESGDDVIITGAGNDAITVGGGANTVNTGDGHDSVAILLDNVNSVDGGAGNDTLTLSGVTTFDGTTATAIDDFGSTYVGFEHFIIYGFDVAVSDVSLGAGDDTFNGRGRAFGNDGNDLLFGSTRTDRFYGGNGNDNLQGNSGNDVLEGGDGDDRIEGGDGDDILRGGNGDDVIFAGMAGADNINAGAGNDMIFISTGMTGQVNGGSGRDRLSYFANDNATMLFDLEDTSVNSIGFEHSGIDAISFSAGNGNDHISGGAEGDLINVFTGANVVDGRGGNDTISYQYGSANTIDGGTGADFLRVFTFGSALLFTVAGNTANDGNGSVISNIESYEIIGAGGDDQVVLGDGDDYFAGDDGSDTASGGGGKDLFQGNDGDDTLNGGGGNDVLRGGRHNDTLDGGDGNDVLSGSSGIDTLTGGDGNDRFAFGGLQDAAAPVEADTITDFHEGEDIISLKTIDAIHGGTDDAFSFIGIDAFSATAGELRMYFDNNTLATVLAGDVDGDGAADFEIQLIGQPLLLDILDHVIL